MATEQQVTCINKSGRTDPHERITRIGGIYDNGTRWSLSQEEAILDIESGKRTFYVSRNGFKVKVIIAKSAYGNKYIKTESDSTTVDNLLSLPECPRV